MFYEGKARCACELGIAPCLSGECAHLSAIYQVVEIVVERRDCGDLGIEPNESQELFEPKEARHLRQRRRVTSAAAVDDKRRHLYAPPSGKTYVRWVDCPSISCKQSIHICHQNYCNTHCTLEVVNTAVPLPTANRTVLICNNLYVIVAS